MTIRYDEKGKFFTDIVAKDPIPVVVQTLIHRLEGSMYVRQDERLKDALDKDEQFLAMTDVTAKTLQGKEIYQSDFLLVNIDHIVWMTQNDNDPK